MNPPDQNIFSEKVILIYKGEVTHNLLVNLLESFEERLEEIEGERSIRKKCFNIATECIENLRHHSTYPLNGQSVNMTEGNSRSSMIMITVDPEYYTFLTCNYIKRREEILITQKIDKINAMDSMELRSYYKDVMSTGGMSDKGTAGLGFIDIARKSNNKLKYEFNRVNDEISYYTFSVKLNRQQD